MSHSARTASPEVIAAVRTAYAESIQAPSVVRPFGLVAIGAKPASLLTFNRDADGDLRRGLFKSWWAAKSFLEVLRASDLTVLTFPSYDGDTMDVVVVAPTPEPSREGPPLPARLHGPERQR